MVTRIFTRTPRRYIGTYNACNSLAKLKCVHTFVSNSNFNYRGATL